MGVTKNLIDKPKEEDDEIVADDDLVPPVPPDGGWGWVVVIASLFCNIIVDGVCFSFGIFFIAFQEHFHSTTSATSWVGSLLIGIYLIMGPLASALANKFGCRVITIAGAIITTIAFVMAIMAPNIEILIVAYGIFGGIGFGLIYLPSIVIVGFYFERRRAFATGIAVCGSGIGTLVFAPLAESLLEKYDWKGSLLIMAGIVLNCCIGGALFRPLEYTKPKNRGKYRKEGDIPRSKIRRGSIFQKIIEEKARQRTISQGSLDGCVITRNNELVKLPAHLRISLSNQMMNRIAQDNMSGNRTPGAGPSPKNGANDPSTSQAGYAVPKQSPDGDTQSLQVCLTRRGTDPNPLVNANGLKFGGSLPASCASSLHTAGGSAGELDPYAEQQRLEQEKDMIVEQISKDMARPMYRKDILYSGSMMRVPQYVSTPDVKEYVVSVTSIPENQYYTDSMFNKYCPSLKAMMDVIKEMLDFHLLRSPTFVVFCLSSVFSMLGFFVPFTFIVDNALELEVDPDLAYYLISALGFMNIIGRVMTGFISDRPWADCLIINSFALIIAGILTALCPFCSTFVHLMLYVAGFGLCIAAFVSLRSILVVELMGLEKLTNAFGILILFQGIATIVGTPLAGAFKDVTGSYDITFYLAGGMISMSGLMCLPLRRLNAWENRQKGLGNRTYYHGDETDSCQIDSMITSV
ncbi:monocarboxylate transporter 12-B-like isoform X2 [Tubulanus polymorphus]